MNDRQRELARIRLAARALKEKGTSVTVTLTKQEEAMLQDVVSGSPSSRRTPIQRTNFFQLLLIRNWQRWQEQKAQLGKCRACGKLKAEGGCEGERREANTF
ncbi:hypothetical protein ACKU5V_027685 [Klebsiella pneumoniae]